MGAEDIIEGTMDEAGILECVFLQESASEPEPAIEAGLIILDSSLKSDVTITVPKPKGEDRFAGTGVIVAKAGDVEQSIGALVVWDSYRAPITAKFGNRTYTLIRKYDVVLSFNAQEIASMLDQTLTFEPWAPHLAQEQSQFLYTPDETKANWAVPVFDLEGNVNVHAVEAAVNGFDELDATIQEAIRPRLTQIYTDILKQPLPECLQEVTASAEGNDGSINQVSQTEGQDSMDKDKLSFAQKLLNLICGTSEEPAVDQTDETTEATDEPTENTETPESEDVDQAAVLDELASKVADIVLAKLNQGEAETTEEETPTEQAEEEAAEEQTTEEETEQTSDNEEGGLLELAGVISGLVEEVKALKEIAPVSGQVKLGTSGAGGSVTEDTGDLLDLGASFGKKGS